MLNYSIPYLSAALLLGFLGINRKMGFWGYFFSSLLLTPVMGLLLLLASDPKPKQNDKKPTLTDAPGKIQP